MTPAGENGTVEWREEEFAIPHITFQNSPRCPDGKTLEVPPRELLLLSPLGFQMELGREPSEVWSGASVQGQMTYGSSARLSRPSPLEAPIQFPFPGTSWSWAPLWCPLFPSAYSLVFFLRVTSELFWLRLISSFYMVALPPLSVSTAHLKALFSFLKHSL